MFEAKSMASPKHCMNASETDIRSIFIYFLHYLGLWSEILVAGNWVGVLGGTVYLLEWFLVPGTGIYLRIKWPSSKNNGYIY
jgi:hypothetical protein